MPKRAAPGGADGDTAATASAMDAHRLGRRLGEEARPLARDLRWQWCEGWAERGVRAGGEERGVRVGGWGASVVGVGTVSAAAGIATSERASTRWFGSGLGFGSG